MRPALTLIELIFTMVIVALVFMVVPKIVFVTNKSFETTMKEDALYNAMALTGMIVQLPWDSNNTLHDQILTTEAGDESFKCDDTTGFYRIGGFKGGRNCIDNSLEPMAASATPGREGDAYDDLDDYDGYHLVTTTPHGAKYRIDVKAAYRSDPPPGAQVDLATLSPSSRSTNIKEVNVTVRNDTANTKSPFISSIYYESANIGLTAIRRRAWK
jgi:hypothetical protein